MQLSVVYMYVCDEQFALALMRTLAQPTTVECYVSQIGFNVSVTFTYAPLLARTIRIYRIFTGGRRAKDPPSLTSPLAQILIDIAPDTRLTRSCAPISEFNLSKEESTPCWIMYTTPYTEQLCCSNTHSQSYHRGAGKSTV